MTIFGHLSIIYTLFRLKGLAVWYPKPLDNDQYYRGLYRVLDIGTLLQENEDKRRSVSIWLEPLYMKMIVKITWKTMGNLCKSHNEVMKNGVQFGENMFIFYLNGTLQKQIPKNFTPEQKSFEVPYIKINLWNDKTLFFFFVDGDVHVYIELDYGHLMLACNDGKI